MCGVSVARTTQPCGLRNSLGDTPHIGVICIFGLQGMSKIVMPISVSVKKSTFSVDKYGIYDIFWSYSNYNKYCT